MPDNVIILVTRNILIAYLAIIVMMPVNLSPVRQELLKIWKTLNAPLPLMRQKPAGQEKRVKFWEIDMTKFEP